MTPDSAAGAGSARSETFSVIFPECAEFSAGAEFPGFAKFAGRAEASAPDPQISAADGSPAARVGIAF
jgi:hypothetical protein